MCEKYGIKLMDIVAEQLTRPFEVLVKAHMNVCPHPLSFSLSPTGQTLCLLDNYALLCLFP